jgi:hypothetical protein
MHNYLVLIKGLTNNLIIIIYLYLKIALSLFRLKVLLIMKDIYSIYLFFKKRNEN